MGTCHVHEDDRIAIPRKFDEVVHRRGHSELFQRRRRQSWTRDSVRYHRSRAGRKSTVDQTQNQSENFPPALRSFSTRLSSRLDRSRSRRERSGHSDRFDSRLSRRCGRSEGVHMAISEQQFERHCLCRYSNLLPSNGDD